MLIKRVQHTENKAFESEGEYMTLNCLNYEQEPTGEKKIPYIGYRHGKEYLYGTEVKQCLLENLGCLVSKISKF